jgi:hypothetical protein
LVDAISADRARHLRIRSIRATSARERANVPNSAHRAVSQMGDATMNLLAGHGVFIALARRW